MTAYLRIWPPASRQYRSGRRAKPTGCMVIHTAETTPGFKPPDRAAENVANFIRKRQDPGSYHTIVDSDSSIQLVEYRDEAFHDGTGSNPWSIGLSVATFAASWSTAPDHWVDGAIQRLAEAAAEANDWLTANGHPPCPARRITREQSNAGEAGFISHAERDPGRRSDPGSDFPWADFLAAYNQLINPEPNDMDITVTPTEAVRLVFGRHLNREPDARGGDWWAYELMMGGHTLDQLDQAVLNSPEGQRKLAEWAKATE